MTTTFKNNINFGEKENVQLKSSWKLGRKLLQSSEECEGTLILLNQMKFQTNIKQQLQ